MDDSLLPRIDMARTTMRPAEAQVAAVILAPTGHSLLQRANSLRLPAYPPRLSCAFAEPLG